MIHHLDENEDPESHLLLFVFFFYGFHKQYTEENVVRRGEGCRTRCKFFPLIGWRGRRSLVKAGPPQSHQDARNDSFRFGKRGEKRSCGTAAATRRANSSGLKMQGRKLISRERVQLDVEVV